MQIRDILIVTFFTLLPMVCFAGTAGTIPEPGTMSLVAIGAVAVAAYAKRPKK